MPIFILKLIFFCHSAGNDRQSVLYNPKFPNLASQCVQTQHVFEPEFGQLFSAQRLFKTLLGLSACTSESIGLEQIPKCSGSEGNHRQQSPGSSL